MRVDMNFGLFVFINKAVKSCVSDVTDGEQGNRDYSKKTVGYCDEILKKETQ
jgi:hypothetical protein